MSFKDCVLVVFNLNAGNKKERNAKTTKIIMETILYRKRVVEWERREG